MASFKDRFIKANHIIGQLVKNQTITGKTIIAGSTAGDLTVNAIKYGDELESVIDITTPADLTNEFSITADGTINNTGGTDTSTKTLIVTWYQWVPR